MEYSKLLEALGEYQKPTYLYDLKSVQTQVMELKKNLPFAQVFYAMKANHNEEILRELRGHGVGLDIVSGGELRCAQDYGFLPGRIIFSGVGKTREELRLAERLGVYQINVESVPELLRIVDMGLKLPIALRVNPHIGIQSHPYITTGLKENKFGIPEDELAEALAVVEQFPENLNFVGLSLHLGSQMLDLSPLELATEKMVQLFLKLSARFPSLARLDLGGGLGVTYDGSDSQKLFLHYVRILEKVHFQLKNIEIQIEPGRFLVARSGFLVTQVQYVKRTSHKVFVIVDTGMHHFLRPALYQAEHRIEVLQSQKEIRQWKESEILCDIVGPICESSDVLARGIRLKEVKEGDLLVIRDVGAYGSVMASSYNLQPPPLEKTFLSY